MNEKISVIMSIYNCATYLPDAIDSILSQTYREWELIICDDASTDDTFQVALEYKKRFPERIILIQNKNNMKLAYSLNRCLHLASGKYIARMDGDDKSLPDRFERQIEYLKKHPEFDLVGTAMQRFDDSGKGMVINAVIDPNYYTLRTTNPFHHATIIAYKYVYDKLNGYTVAKRTMRGQDYDLWFRFYHEGFKGNNIDIPLYLVREDENAVRRRSPISRIRTIPTLIFGYKLLRYPWWWAIGPIIRTFFKCLIPYRCVDLYRSWQGRKTKETKHQIG